jgi:hypothetical protein
MLRIEVMEKGKKALFINNSISCKYYSFGESVTEINVQVVTTVKVLL